MNELELRKHRIAMAPPPLYKVGDRVEVWSTSSPDRTDVGTIIRVWERYGGQDEKDLYIIRLDAPLKSSLPANQGFEIGRGPESLRRWCPGPDKTEMEDED